MNTEINVTNALLINELRERGLYVLALTPKDFSEYELTHGRVEMTEAEALQLIARAAPVLDRVVMESVWDVVGEVVAEFKRERDSQNEEDGQDRESYTDDQGSKTYSTEDDL